MNSSEFEGRGNQTNGVMPPPHSPTASEQLGLLYRTGDATGATLKDAEGVVFRGLLPYEEQLALRQVEGVMAKGIKPYEELL